MIKLIYIASFIIVGQCRLLNLDGRDMFLNGPNIAWNQYGHDFGDNSWGNDYNPQWWESTFTQLQEYGANSIRAWLHCKGELNPIFENGYCKGLNHNMIENLQDMLQRAKNHHLLVILTLFDFLISETNQKELIKDQSKTQSYIDNCLTPLLQALDKFDNLIAYEVFNEPEWITENYQGFKVSEVQRMTGMVAETVHTKSSKLFTVGSAALKWNSQVNPAVENYWSDQALQRQYSSPHAYLDFYSIHYYDWMDPYYTPFGKPYDFWQLDKPTLIGESGDQGKYRFDQQYERAYQNGWAGLMAWSYNDGDKFSFSNYKDHMRNFRNNHHDIVNY